MPCTTPSARKSRPNLDDVVLIPWNACTQTDRGCFSCHYLSEDAVLTSSPAQGSNPGPLPGLQCHQRGTLVVLLQSELQFEIQQGPWQCTVGFPIPIHTIIASPCPLLPPDALLLQQTGCN